MIKKKKKDKTIVSFELTGIHSVQPPQLASGKNRVTSIDQDEP